MIFQLCFWERLLDVEWQSDISKLSEKSTAKKT